MSGAREATASFLDDHPDAEEDLQTLLEIDQRGEWTFEEIPFDSGLFGELVSRGIAEQSDNGYQLSDRQAVKAALSGESAPTTPTEETTSPRITIPDVDIESTSMVFGALLFLVVLRLLPYSHVFRGDDIVLLANDPYYYRYWLEQLLTQSNGVTTLEILSSFPETISKGEPLLLATLWLGSRLLGGDSVAAGTVLAWYPVVSAVSVGAILYVLGTRLFADRRVGLAAVGMLAITPMHVLRTALGFADHHAFDYVWLALTMLALVVLAEDNDFRNRSTWIASAGLGIAVAGQTLAWEAGPLLLLPLGFYIFVRSLITLHAKRSLLRAELPLVSGLALGSLLTYLVHQSLGWHTLVVASAPLLLFVGSAGLLVLSLIASRIGISARLLGGVELGTVGVLFIILPEIFPALAVGLNRGIDFLLETEGIAETASLISGRLGSIFGPAFLFGWVLFLALPYLGWLSFRAYRDHDSAILVPVVYGWFLLVLAVIQLRFAGELAIPIAVVAGVGFVHLASRVDIARPLSYGEDASRPEAHDRQQSTVLSPQLPDRHTTVSLLVIFLLLGSMSFVQIPIKSNQLAISDSQYQAAQQMEGFAAEQGWEYPENYVFSQWDRNRMYNYFVNGQARSYSYAQSNYGDFLVATNGEKWYRTLRDRAGFVVTVEFSPEIAEFDERSLQTRLQTHYGSETRSAPALSHYRAIYVSPDGSVKAFALVSGARLVGTAPPSTEISITTTQSVSGQQFTYSRTVESSAAGRYAVTVPYPGNYTVNGNPVHVSESAVMQNETVALS
ncbi:STT3 domain-containing protein [Haloplanus aerogenes]|uniref:dolichyl-phosphooligosaccharide-protein glycotransferase n=1 Tax=Haloplanus aerogenes TaxID=660522 RepID=A0A3M0CN38_9EURY|nr:STT3 domain-containing protein [Haloplanus aerogenes]AZH24798.1 hypothetical protein DU502_05150 [Haloplanus aerogenes]RMB08339.1 dolichyl-diphosphooligosaccharide--protein glycosyltransferase [Haloplanus aerogenes]